MAKPKGNPERTTLQQRTLVAELANGATLTEAGKRAHYASPSEAHRARWRTKLDKLADRLGLTNEYILTEIKKNTQANRIELAQHNGQFTDRAEVPDNPTRVKSLETAAKLKGMYPTEDSEGKPATVAVQIITNVKLDSP